MFETIENDDVCEYIYIITAFGGHAGLLRAVKTNFSRRPVRRWSRGRGRGVLVLQDERERMAKRPAARRTTGEVAVLGRQQAAVDVHGFRVPSGDAVSAHSRVGVQGDVLVVRHDVQHAFDPGRPGKEDRGRAHGDPGLRHLEAADGVRTGADAGRHAVAGAARRRRVRVRRSAGRQLDVRVITRPWRPALRDEGFVAPGVVGTVPTYVDGFSRISSF